MNVAHPQGQSWLDWAVASRPLPSEAVSGDLHVIKSFDHGTLLAAVDGVGHGEEATAAAQIAVAVLERHAQESVISLVTRCHRALAATRGVVMTLASLHVLENTVAWIGVGNVEGRLLRADPSSSHPAESVLLRGGVVGHQLPPLQASVLSVAPGDMLVFATDGVRSAFVEGIWLKEAPHSLADRLLARYFKGTDDALVLVARYLGGPRA
jgi:hypothetical protein